MAQLFSLLYPEGHDNKNNHFSSDLSFFEKLGLNKLVNLSSKRSLPWNVGKNEFANLTTSNRDVIQYRLDIIEDLINNPKICDVLDEALPQIETIAQLRTDKSRVTDTTAALYSVSEIELYTECIDLLYNAITNANKLTSQGLTRFFSMINEIHESEEYQKLKENSRELMKNTRSIRSVTIGVNLDPQLQAVEAGVVSVNSELYRSGDIIDRILRLDHKDDGFRCLTPLIPYGKSKADHNAVAFTSGINNAIDTIFRNTVKSWSPIIRRYLAQNTDFLVKLSKDIRLLLGGVELITKLKELGVPMCKPEVCDKNEQVFEASNLYNPHIALSLGKERIRELVFNNLTFDEHGKIYILTGANQGGKTAITYATGIAHALFQLGFFVPARSAKISPVDNILLHFPGSGSTIGKGRLGEECANLKELLQAANKHSLVLMDEALSSTSAVEASYIASEVLVALSSIGVRCIFATHLHDLAQQIDEMNDHPQRKSKFDNLVAEVSKNDNKRSFKVTRTQPDGLSYAKSVAEKYGITLEQIMESKG